MSSLEIAEITGKEHRNVLRDIRTILEQAGIGLLKFESSYLNAQNKPQPCYHLPRLECDLVVSGYSVPYRLAIIKRWHELEAKETINAPPAPVVPQTRGEALRLAADLADQNEAQARLLETQQPTVELVEDYLMPLSSTASGRRRMGGDVFRARPSSVSKTEERLQNARRCVYRGQSTKPISTALGACRADVL